MKKSYKLQYCIFTLMVIAVFIGLFKLLQVKDVTMDAIKHDVVNSTDVSVMQEDDGTRLKKLYGINKRDIEDFILYAPKSNMEANEILILKTKTQEDIKSLKIKINDRVQKQSDSFKNYNEAQYEIISNYVLEEKNQYLILVISKDSQQIKKSIDESF